MQHAEINRNLFKCLDDWKKGHDRKPLLVRGARQVGKSFSINSWAKQRFLAGNYLEINLEERPDIGEIFKKNLVVDRILDELQLITGTNLRRPEALLFIDEVQVCPQAITALRYFYEKFPSLYVIAAGSLIDFILEDVGFPVGRLDSIFMPPVTFFEFLEAIGKKTAAPI